MLLSRTVDADTEVFDTVVEPEVADSNSMPNSWMGAAGDPSQHSSRTRWKRRSGIAAREPLQRQHAVAANDIAGGAAAGSHDPPAMNFHSSSFGTKLFDNRTIIDRPKSEHVRILALYCSIKTVLLLTM